MKKVLLILGFMGCLSAFAQESDENSESKERGFKKQNLFTGGGITLSFSNNGTVLGASPVFGYSITKWLDAGIVVNYIYSSIRNVTYYNPNNGSYYFSDDKLRQSTYGPGAFVRVFPVRFLFLQGQAEHNFITQKLIFDDGRPSEKENTSATSILVGGGYCNGRQNIGDVFYYVSILFDVKKDKRSPYVEQNASGSVDVLPIIRAGLQIPLFQGKSLF